MQSQSCSAGKACPERAHEPHTKCQIHVAYAQQQALQLMHRPFALTVYTIRPNLTLSGTTPTIKAQHCSGQQSSTSKKLSGLELYQDWAGLDQDWIRTESLDQDWITRSGLDRIGYGTFGSTAYRGRWGNFVDVVASVSGHDRFPVLALMARQVLFSHDAAPFLDGSYNGFCYPALVETCTQKHRHGHESDEGGDDCYCTAAVTV